MKVYHDKDIDGSILDDMTVAVLGYGSQGRAQALNMRDSGLTVIVGNIRDRSYDQAKEDGFETYLIPEAVKKASIVFILLPDEVPTTLPGRASSQRA